MPLKRHPALRSLSLDHHQALLLCWKIRQGLRHHVEPHRISAYAHWFWDQHLRTHFEAEELYVFTILPEEHEGIRLALQDHRRLQSYFGQEPLTTAILKKIETELDRHIRFEERIIFEEIQRLATPQQLKEVERHHEDHVVDGDWADEFWKTTGTQPVCRIAEAMMPLPPFPYHLP